MTDFLKTMEMLIDRLILHLPSEWFVDAPFLAMLLSNPNGRYVLAGMLTVASLLLGWVALLFIQVLLGGLLGKHKTGVLQTSKEQSKLSTEKVPEGFKFFKRNDAGAEVIGDDVALRTIEQEMLTVRQRYVDGHILQDVYVAETRRLYISAKALKP